MKNIAKRNLIYTIVALSLSVLLLLTAVFAWFSPNGINNSFSIYSGELDLSVAFYLANDVNKDGIFDTVGEARQNLSRSENIATYYTPVQKNGISTYGNFIAGNMLTFKLVVSNPLNNTSNAVVDFALSGMDSYVFSALDHFANTYVAGTETQAATGQLVPDGTNEDTLFNGFSARTMFVLEKFSIKVYSTASATDGITQGFDTLVASTDGTAEQTLPTPADKKLWEVSNGEKITEPLPLLRGQLIEIDFCLTLMQLSEALIAEYNQYATDNYVARCTAILGQDRQEVAAAYVQRFISAEMGYQNYTGNGNDEEDTRENYFVINKIFVYGRQTAVTI